MPATSTPDPLRDALEALLREPEAEMLSILAAKADTALEELLGQVIRQSGTAKFLWADLGLPPRWGPEESPLEDWARVVQAWQAFREARFAPLVPALGPLAGTIPEEILFEAYPKALATVLHGQDLPLPAWIEFLQSLQPAGVLAAPGKPGLALWKLSAPAAWFARHRLRESDPTLKESIWRVYANVCGAYAQIALDGLGNPAATSARDALVARLAQVRGSLGSAFDYLIARHRPSRAKPLLDLLRILDLESALAGFPDKIDHARRLQTWVLCHPQGEFCPPEQRPDLAKAWLELTVLDQELNRAAPRPESLPAIQDLLVDDGSVLAADLAEAAARHHLAVPDADRQVLLTGAARLLLYSEQLPRAVRCALAALLSDRSQDPPLLEDQQKDALWDLAEILLDPDSGRLSGSLALQGALILLGSGEDALALLERALSQAEDEPLAADEFEAIVKFLFHHVARFAGNNFIYSLLERLAKAIGRRHSDDPETVNRAAAELHLFSGSEDAALRLSLATLSLRLLLTTAYAGPRDFATHRLRLNSAENAYQAAISTDPDSSTEEIYARHPEILTLIDLRHYHPKNPTTPGETVKIRVNLPEGIRAAFPRPGALYWEIIANLEAAGLLPDRVAREMAAQLNWEATPFHEQLRARAEQIREEFLAPLP